MSYDSATTCSTPSRARVATRWHRTSVGLPVGRALAFALLGYGPVFAIPSPDVVVNLFASAAQVMGLLSVAAGGVFVSRRRRTLRSADGRAALGSAPAGRWALWLLCGCLVASVAGNVFQHCARADELNRRLRLNLTRASQENGKKVGDASLLTLTMSGQAKHPHSISTEDLERKISAGEALNLIDVREPEEVEMGRIDGAWHTRYPDLQKNPTGLRVEGKETILLCYSGNRSSELVNGFTPKGFDCKFMIGGYEKWIAEDRPITLAPGARRRELRDIPDYPNKENLLETAEAERLVRDEAAVVVDVRYPGDFATGHIPDALNLSIRKMPTEEMWAAINAIERRPIIVACYDKRGSFYGRILGLRLHRAGHDFRGRYTVPHEFGLGPANEEDAREYVARWEADNQRTLLSEAALPLAGLLSWLNSWLGHLALAILAAVVLIRLVVLPLTLKADRDRVVERELAAEVARLKAKHAGDRGGYARALWALQRQSGITPLRNFLGTLAQLLIFVLFFNAVGQSAVGVTDGLFWVASLGAPDAAGVLPAAVGLMLVAILASSSVRRGRVASLFRLAGGAFIALVAWPLAAAVNFYLVVNLGLILLQSLLVRRWRARRATESARKPCLRAQGVVPLRLANRAPGCGNKAARLGRMIEAGLPVPDGFVVTQIALGAVGSRLQLGSRDVRRIAREWRRLGAERVAVRSSGANEDGADKSYAGVFESILDVSRSGFMEALGSVRASLMSGRALAYGGLEVESGAVLVQRMVDAEFAGVLFTEHPDESGSMLVELVHGTGDALVSGRVSPQAHRFGRVSGRLLDAATPPLDLRLLVDLGRKVEKLFGRPQDIEWAYAGGRFVLLQSRDITATRREACEACEADAESAPIERERHRLLEVIHGASAEEVVLEQNELSEVLPRPTPMSLSLVAALYDAGGATESACRRLGIPYAVEEGSAPVVESVFGALYVNRREERRRIGRGPGLLAAFRIGRLASHLESDFRDGFLPAYLRRVQHLAAIDPARLDVAEHLALIEAWRRELVEDVYVEAELVNVTADFYAKVAVRELERRGLDPAVHLGCGAGSVVHDAMALLAAVRTGERPVSEFLSLFGHRAVHDYELAEPRFVEDAAAVDRLVSRSGGGAYGGSEFGRVPRAEAPPLDSGSVRGVVERALRFEKLKEEAKHHVLRFLAVLRRAVVVLDDRLGLDGGIFHLRFDELASLADPSLCATVKATIAERRSASERFERMALPASLRAVDLEALSGSGPAPQGDAQLGDPARCDLCGLLVAGRGGVEGRARVVRSAADVAAFQEGEVLVARFTEPDWMPIFPRAAGIVTEVGGRLSHAAIVAREYNLTAIVGVRGATSRIATGDRVRLSADGTVEVVRAPGASPARKLCIRVTLRRQSLLIEAMLEEISATGALVSVTGDDNARLEPGEAVTLEVEAQGTSYAATVVGVGARGALDLSFLDRSAAEVVSGPIYN